MLTKGAIGNLVNRYNAVLKKCRLMNMFASLAIACTITIAVPTISLAENYIISKSTNWGDYTLENYNHRARMLHGGETLTILNDAIVTFDFTNPSSAIPITKGGCIIYSVDFFHSDGYKAGDVAISGGTILGKSAHPETGYGIYVYEDYPSKIELQNTNLILSDFNMGISAGNGTVDITNSSTIFTNINYGVYTKNNAHIDIKSKDFSISDSYIPVYAGGNSSVNIQEADNIDLNFSHSGIYSKDSATVAMKSSNFSMTGQYGLNASGNSSILVEADNVSLDAGALAYGEDNSTIRLAANSSGTLYGDVAAFGASNISLELGGTTQWTGASGKSAEARLQVELEDTATWHVLPAYTSETEYQPSEASRLQFTGGGIADLASAREYQKLSIGELAGNGGTFRLKVEDDSTDGVDQVDIVRYDSGSNSIYVVSSGNTEISAEEMNTYLVRQENGSGTFGLANTDQQVDLGLYLYKLASRTNDATTEWYLQRVESIVPVDPDDPTPPVNPNPPLSPTGETEAALSGLAGHYAMWYGQLTDLRKRLGEVRYGTQTGLWVRGFADKSRLDGLGGTSFTQNMFGGSIGYDTLASVSEESLWLVGMQLRSARAHQSVNGHWGGHGDLTSVGGGLYSTWAHADGWYVDAVGTMDWYNHKLRTSMLDGTRVHDDRSSYGLGASLEAGRKLDFAFSNEGRDYWFLEPQLQLSYFWVKGGDFHASNGMKIEQKNMDSLTGRAGLVLGKKFSLEGGNGERYMQPYVKAGVNHEFLGEQEARINGVRMTSDLDGTRVYYGAGVDWQATDNLRLYMQAEREHGEHFTREYNVSAGLKWKF
ncbi:outer membrane autotransporter barrel domain-containing protein [Bilophila wadsworthia 3_1_6]|uniref:Outer membrane autotransporter barrel domain-containing protein n=1 Tax=Bilophila wadsworthia (strain 3_1_6) TaxID=563192 RepID=E5Y6V5_BILW3|nr:autotransporter outer membrane beta-barrel domain-containing protein [Bilophila wadsworthia]EFV44296.2 outer membrane autotransporter barrel domain-containing protein [Bilophila wadsworthia 3_1_6]